MTNKKYQKFLRRISAPGAIANTTTKAPITLDRVLANIASLSQPLMLAVVVFGYFYTVKPVFQKELISEQLAELQIAQQKANQKLQEHTNEIEIKKIELAHLQNEKDELTAKIRTMAATEKAALDENKAVNKKIKIASKRLDETQNNLKKTTGELYKKRILQITGSFTLPQEYRLLLSKENAYQIFKTEHKHQVAERLKNALPKPEEIAEAKLKNNSNFIISGNDTIGKKLKSEYAKGLTKYKKHLSCTTPNFQLWQDEFIKSINSPSSTKQCVNHHFKNLIAEKNWSEKEVIKLKDDSYWPMQEKIYKESCELWLPYGVERFFARKWEEKTEPCEERLIKISSIILEQEPITSLSKNTPIDPPSENEVQQELTNLINQWN